jgi:hypothetical protein
VIESFRAFPGKVDLKGVHARLRGLWVFREEMRQTSKLERFPSTGHAISWST